MHKRPLERKELRHKMLVGFMARGKAGLGCLPKLCNDLAPRKEKDQPVQDEMLVEVEDNSCSKMSKGHGLHGSMQILVRSSGQSFGKLNNHTLSFSPHQSTICTAIQNNKTQADPR